VTIFGPPLVCTTATLRAPGASTSPIFFTSLSCSPTMTIFSVPALAALTAAATNTPLLSPHVHDGASGLSSSSATRPSSHGFT
jgi:hypothetical protein